jgi:hypothetical protein
MQEGQMGAAHQACTTAGSYRKLQMQMCQWAKTTQTCFFFGLASDAVLFNCEFSEL